MTTIKLKNGSGAPTAGDLAQGEPALDLTNKRLYTEDSGGTVIEVGTNPGVDVTFADNRKAIFGAGSDLKIYHDGSDSYIDDTGTGRLRLRGAADIILAHPTNGETYAIFSANGANTFYYDDSAKLATTSTGIDVTGDVTADGLTVESTGATYFNAAVDAGTGLTTLKSTNNSTGGSLKIQTGGSDRFQISAIGDISFYEDTGTTAKFFWDASAESLGIGTSSVAGALHVERENNYGGTNFEDNPHLLISNGTPTNHTAVLMFQSSGTDVANKRSGITGGNYHSNKHGLSFLGDLSGKDRTATPDMFIDSSGNVGIGTDSPVSPLHVYSGANGNIIHANGAVNAWDFILKGTNDGDVNSVLYELGMYRDDGTTNPNTVLKFGRGTGTQNGFFAIDQNGSEAMRLDTSGNLLVANTTQVIFSSSSITGHNIAATGTAQHNASEETVMYLNRLSTDGAIVDFRKDGSTVGSIGSSSGRLYIHNNYGSGSGLRFDDAALRPADSSGTGEDATTDLGATGVRFKDLYLSGDVNLANNSQITFASTSCNIEGNSSGADFIKFTTANSEAARFDSSGNLLVGTTSTSGVQLATSGGLVSNGDENFWLSRNVGGGSTMNVGRTSTAGTGTFVEWCYNGAVKGTVTTNGTTTAYNTSSDQRLKENIVDAPSASDDIDAIQVRSFDWKVDGSHQKYGMVAQELQSVAPEAVSVGETEEDMMGVDYSKLVPMLVKEIQSLRARVAQLEGAN